MVAGVMQVVAAALAPKPVTLTVVAVPVSVPSDTRWKPWPLIWIDVPAVPLAVYFVLDIHEAYTY